LTVSQNPEELENKEQFTQNQQEIRTGLFGFSFKRALSDGS